MAQQVTTPRLDVFQTWSFEKAMMEIRQHSPSESSSSSEFFEDRVKIKPDMGAMKKSVEDQKSPGLFDERYMSSEEALSPMEDNEDDFSADEIHEAEVVLFKSVVKFAVAICIFSPGKPKVVDVPVPSLTNSPSIQSTASSSSVRNEGFLVRPPTPVRSVKRKAILIQKDTPLPVPSLPQPFFTNTITSTPRLPHITSQLQQAGESTSSTTTLSSTLSPSPAFLTQDPYQDVAPTQKLGHSRLRNLSAKLARFHLNSSTTTQKSDLPPTPTFSRPRRTSSTMISNRKASIPSTPSFTYLPPLNFTATNLSTTSTAKRKMVARGAAEREPMIELPPFPDDDGIDELHSFPKTTMKRRKSVLGF